MNIYIHACMVSAVLTHTSHLSPCSPAGLGNFYFPGMLCPACCRLSFIQTLIWLPQHRLVFSFHINTFECCIIFYFSFSLFLWFIHGIAYISILLTFMITESQSIKWIKHTLLIKSLGSKIILSIIRNATRFHSLEFNGFVESNTFCVLLYFSFVFLPHSVLFLLLAVALGLGSFKLKLMLFIILHENSVIWPFWVS